MSRQIFWCICTHRTKLINFKKFFIFPNRFCLKITGPGDSNFIAKATIPNIGDNIKIPHPDSNTSSTRFIGIYLCAVGDTKIFNLSKHLKTSVFFNWRLYNPYLKHSKISQIIRIYYTTASLYLQAHFHSDWSYVKI